MIRVARKGPVGQRRKAEEGPRGGDSLPIGVKVVVMGELKVYVSYG